MGCSLLAGLAAKVTGEPLSAKAWGGRCGRNLPREAGFGASTIRRDKTLSVLYTITHTINMYSLYDNL